MKKLRIRQTLRYSLTFYAVLTFVSLPIFCMYSDKTPIFNYSVAKFAMMTLKSKNVMFLLISFALLALLLLTAQRIMYRDLILPIICSLIFIADIVQVILYAAKITTYVAIVFDLFFLVLFVIYFVKQIKRAIAIR